MRIYSGSMSHFGSKIGGPKTLGLTRMLKCLLKQTWNPVRQNGNLLIQSFALDSFWWFPQTLRTKLYLKECGALKLGTSLKKRSLLETRSNYKPLPESGRLTGIQKVTLCMSKVRSEMLTWHMLSSMRFLASVTLVVFFSCTNRALRMVGEWVSLVGSLQQVCSQPESLRSRVQSFFRPCKNRISKTVFTSGFLTQEASLEFKNNLITMIKVQINRNLLLGIR